MSFHLGRALCFVPIDATVSSIAKAVTGEEQALNICRIEFTFYRDIRLLQGYWWR